LTGEGEEREVRAALERVRAGMAAAARRCGRREGEVELLAISKNVPAEIVGIAAGLGLRVFGESRVQEARAKIPALPPDLIWHMVGQLQTNKAREAFRLFKLIHSLDRLELARILSRLGEAAKSACNVLIQVNVSGMAQQGGVKPEEVPELIEKCSELPYLRYCGLMAIGPYPASERDIRSAYRAVKGLFDTLAGSLGAEFKTLSMGMSGDYEIAIEEGSTLVRIGTSIFGERRY